MKPTNNTHIPFDQKRKADFQLEIPSKLESLVDVEALTEKVADKYRIQGDDRDNLAIAITEMVNNAIIHGNKFDQAKKVVVSFYYDKGSLSVYIKDNGTGFDPNNVGNPLDPENLMKESGRGIFILKSIMDDVHFHYSPNGMEVQITKKIKS